MARIVPPGVGRRRELPPTSCRELRPPVRAVRTDGQRCTSWWSRITPHGPRPQAPTWRRHACVSRCGSVDGMPVHAARRLPLTSRPRSLPRRLSTTCSEGRCVSPRAVLSSSFFVRPRASPSPLSVRHACRRVWRSTIGPLCGFCGRGADAAAAVPRAILTAWELRLCFCRVSAFRAASLAKASVLRPRGGVDK